MRSTRPAFSVLFLLFLTFCSTTIIARAAGDDAEEADDYDLKTRVARISLITGEVNLKRDGNTDWERARLNYPLVEGDTIATGSTDRDSRVEIQIDARNFVRLGSNSILRIVTLRDEGVALSVVEGTASIRLAKFDRDHEYFEVDAPKTTLAAEKKGVYRIDVSPEGRVRLTARDGGRARIYSETSGFALRDGRSAELILDGDNAGDWEFVASSGPDSWDDWVNGRERYLAQRLRYDVQYYDSYVWGAEDLDAYGDWTYATDYGWIWRPHTTVINNYYNWAPYRYGRWTWCPPYGWTWVGNEPWGWAPITTAAGSITTTTGPGAHEVSITGIEVGGVRLWSLSIFLLAIRFTGIRSIIINAIRVHATTRPIDIDIETHSRAARLRWGRARCVPMNSPIFGE